MMMKYNALAIAALLAVSGCAATGIKTPSLPSLGGGNNGKIAAVIIAAMNGGLIGGKIGEGLSNADRGAGLEAEYRALEYTQSGKPVTWKGSQAGIYGEVVAAQPYRVGSQDCRQYSHTVTSGGQPRVARGTACRNRDGSWTPLT
jgi:surface antigen